MFTASISREFLGGRCAWLKDQPVMFSLYWAGAQKCKSFSLFKCRHSIIWKGMTTNQSLLHLNKVVQHSMSLIFFPFYPKETSWSLSVLWCSFFSVTSPAASAVAMTFLLKGGLYNSLVCMLELSLHLHHWHLSPSPHWEAGLKAWTSGHSETFEGNCGNDCWECVFKQGELGVRVLEKQISLTLLTASLSLLGCCAFRASWCCSQCSPTTGIFSLFPAPKLWLFLHSSHHHSRCLPPIAAAASLTCADIPHRAVRCFVPLLLSGKTWRTGSEAGRWGIREGCRHISGLNS